MADETPSLEPPKNVLVDSVLLIDGDNDPHFAPDFPITERTLVKVFLRPAATMPRALERRVGHLPLCVSVVSPRGGANAADFVMSLHAGILHACLPMHIPFTLVTNDKSLAAMAQELQRVGRVALLWTSHPEPEKRRRLSPAKPAGAGRPRRGGRGRGAASSARTPRPAPVAATPDAMPSPSAAPAAQGSLEASASLYAARIRRMKNPPSRLKTLLNDITYRGKAPGFTAEQILEELKRSHGFTVDAGGKVHTPPRA